MKKIKNTKELGEKIKNLRIQNKEKFSQEQIANLLWVSRVVLWNIENGERDLKEDELEKISDMFEVSQWYFWIDENDMIEQLDEKDEYFNFKRILLYILNRVWNKPNIWKTVVYKLLYFSEFNHFEINGDTLLWIDFIKWPRWPVPKGADKIFQEMIDDNQLEQITTLFKWYKQHRLVSKLKDIDLDDLPYSKVKLIDDVLEKLSSKTATEISDYSHWDTPYTATENIWDIIDKWLVFYRSQSYSVTDE